MMKLQKSLEQVLFGTSLEDKLIDLESLDASEEIKLSREITHPGRSKEISFSEKQIKFPKVSSFHLDEKKALAMHFFANHELLAIEMMTAALLMFPELGETNRRSLITTIKEEQKHFNLYISRMNKFGVSFGDYPLNDFFWRQFAGVKTPQEFYALVALTFESANLDFALYYQDVFKEVEDIESAKIMGIVLEDEIKHVSRGRSFLANSNGKKDFWDYYISLLPEKVTPARGKGIVFFPETRIKAGLSRVFVEKQKDYKDSFKITSRKGWD